MRPLDQASRLRLADAVLVVGAVLAAGLLCGSTFADAKERVPPIAPAAETHGHAGQPDGTRRDALTAGEVPALAAYIKSLQ